MWIVTADSSLPPRVAEFFESVGRWDAARWRTALLAARIPLHRERRAVSRPLCEAILADQGDKLRCWMVRDGVRTALECLARSGPAREREGIAEVLEDGALALLARPALPLTDLAVLIGPCLPLLTG
jgi:hypothetical protein